MKNSNNSLSVQFIKLTSDLYHFTEVYFKMLIMGVADKIQWALIDVEDILWITNIYLARVVSTAIPVSIKTINYVFFNHKMCDSN